MHGLVLLVWTQVQGAHSNCAITTPMTKPSNPVQGLGLVFVAVYQRALRLLYVDALLERLKAEFAEQVQRRRTGQYLSVHMRSTVGSAACSSSVVELSMSTL